MRALEITLFMIFVITSASVIHGVFMVPTKYGSCTSGAYDCQAQTFLYSMANQSSSLKQVDLNSDGILPTWDQVTFALTFVVFGLFWILYILSTVAIVGPAMTAMFRVPEQLSLYISIGVWILWMVAYTQIKRGGFSWDAYR